MFPYLALMLVIAACTIAVNPQHRTERLLWASAYGGLLLFVGLRHHVGMDWNNYLVMVERVGNTTWIDSFQYAEPGYATLLWSSARLGYGVYGANLIGSAIFLAGVFRYARATPSPWVALTIAVPFLIVVVGMSANRQAVAIGVLLMLAANWERHRLRTRIVAIAVAATFHASAAIFTLFLIQDTHTRRTTKLALGALATASTLVALQTTGRTEYYENLYVTSHEEIAFSPGATYHILLNAAPIIFAFILLGRNWQRAFPNNLVRSMAVLALGLLLAIPWASAAAGRLSLYLFPVSLSFAAWLTRQPRTSNNTLALRLATTALSFTLLVGWLTLSNSGHAHIPYDNALWTEPYMLHSCC